MLKIKVKIAFALPSKQYLFEVSLKDGATVEEAIKASGLLELCPEIDLTKNKVGIYSHPVTLKDVVQNGDRIEIYRILVNDPKELRRKRIKRR